MVFVGWAVWTVLAGYTAVLWTTKVRHANGGVRFLAGRAAILFTVVLFISLDPRFQKVHLIWLAIILYMLSMTWNGMVLDARVKRIPKRAAAESKRTGEAEADIIQRELKRWGYEPQDSQGAIL